MSFSRGSCKWFNSKKGYGFITLDNGEDVFVHQSEIHARGFRSLAEGENIECEVIQDAESGKKKAIKVTGPNGEYVKGDQGDMDHVRRDGGGYNNGGRSAGGYGGRSGGGGGYYGGGGGGYGGGY